jgi:hypothetical protein
MTDEEINIAVAESLGWIDCHKSVASVYGFPSERVVGVPPQRVAYKEVPNYASDLNAMHKAEEVLNEPIHMQKHAWNNYKAKLEEITDGSSFHATARQRAETYLEVIGG